MIHHLFGDFVDAMRRDFDFALALSTVSASIFHCAAVQSLAFIGSSKGYKRCSTDSSSAQMYPTAGSLLIGGVRKGYTMSMNTYFHSQRGILKLLLGGRKGPETTTVWLLVILMGGKSVNEYRMHTF